MVGFVVLQRTVREPMLPLHLFRSGAFTGAQVAAFAISASFFAIFLYATLYLQQVLGLSPIEAGLAYLPGTILNFVVAGATSQLVEKVSPRTMIGAGLVLIAAGMGHMALVTEVGSSWTVMLPGLIVAMVGTGMFNPAVVTVALGSVPVEQSGLAAGINDTFRQAGIAVGVAALGAMVPAADAFGGDAANYVDGLHTALWASAALCVAGAVAAVVLIRGTFAGEAADGNLVPEPAAA